MTLWERVRTWQEHDWVLPGISSLLSLQLITFLVSGACHVSGNSLFPEPAPHNIFLYPGHVVFPSISWIACIFAFRAFLCSGHFFCICSSLHFFYSGIYSSFLGHFWYSECFWFLGYLNLISRNTSFSISGSPDLKFLTHLSRSPRLLGKWVCLLYCSLCLWCKIYCLLK